MTRSCILSSNPIRGKQLSVRPKNDSRNRFLEVPLWSMENGIRVVFGNCGS